MESKRNPGGKLDRGDGVAQEILGMQDHDIGGVALGIVDVRHDPTVVFGRVVKGMDVVKKIEGQGTAPRGVTKQLVLIKDCGELRAEP